MSKYDYDMIVIGGGAAGLTGSGIAANLGAKTMMVEKERLGGDCTWTGCIPSKALLKSARLVRQLKEGSRYGLKDQEVSFDFPEIMDHVRKTIQEVYEDADRPEIFEEMGITVTHGKAKFKDPHTILIEKKDGITETYSSRYFLIATGARAFIPPIPGLNDTNYLTSHSLFEIKEQPDHLLIIGGGPIGTEMAQSFRSLGSEVTVVDAGSGILHKEDPEMVNILQDRLIRQGVKYHFNAEVHEVTEREGELTVHFDCGDTEFEIKGDALLVATGRTANTASLELENTGVIYTAKGVHVDDSCRTNVSHIFASGDVTGEYQFTHMSEHMSKVAVTRALIKIPMKIDRDHVPRVTFTDPELAQIGASEEELKKKGISHEVYRFPYSKIDRALAENDTEGMIKVMAKKLSGNILGATAVGPHAGEIISEYALAMKNGVSMRSLADTIHPYPSWGLGARRAADQWYIRNQSEWSVKWIKRIFGYRGDVPDFSDPNRIV
ncbi:NAD(P)/FAD-dependent oxidoreductase [Balneola sp. MJW-20]|uniref:dihydrolipoyl dehydrogenase family protein n=1 Tax=Gracilimonas aurantiaca TaxID=3234185 RepID=UPI00346500E0